MEKAGFDRIKNILKEVSFFEEFEDNELDFFSKQLSLQAVPKGTVLFSEDEIGDYLFFIVEGSVDVRLETTRAKHIVATYGFGHCVGEMALIDDYPRSATVLVNEPSELLILTKKRMEHMVKKNPILGVKIYKGLAKNLSLRLRGAAGRFSDLA